jgi:lysophospholipase L1-like esterase
VSFRPTAILALALVILGVTSGCGTTAVSVSGPKLPTGAKILFIGDSITDGIAPKNAPPDHALGDGYVHLIAGRLGADAPAQRYRFVNRGRSGDAVPDLARRWRADVIDQKPEVLSILVGINDVWRSVDARQPVPLEQFRATYDKLLADTLAALPDVKIVLGEPFVLRGVTPNERWAEWTKGVNEIRAVVDELALKYNIPLVRYQRLFDQAGERAPVEYWLFDGVHPLCAGQQLMADEWIRTARLAWPR